MEFINFSDVITSTNATPKNTFNDLNDEVSIIQYVHQLLLEAKTKNASDIHFECYENTYRIRMRIDGLLHEVATPKQEYAKRIASRIKIMAQLDISEKRLPQDGRFKINLSANNIIDFRVSTCPTVTGEKLVVRILDSTMTTVDIMQLGLEKNQLEILLKTLTQPQGLILITGPTGSGKTVTLYTLLNYLNKAQVNISTVEDPVEIFIDGINQVNIQPKIGLTFAEILRAFLRQDPDIIMVGEMRDLETAEVTLKAAQTGHLVLSTLHTNSAKATIMRLLSMGIPFYHICASLTLVIAQRLVRILCENCKFYQDKKFIPVGCSLCTDGYRGRIGIFEVLPIKSDLPENENDLTNYIKKNCLLTLEMSARNKIKQGLTTQEEVIRVLNHEIPTN